MVQTNNLIAALAERNEHDSFIRKIVGSGYDEFWKDKHRYRVVKGGRGSKKSTTTALWFIDNIMQYKGSNAVVVRKTSNTHKDSTFAQLKWAANKLGVADKWKFIENPMEATYIPTSQKILFRGFDDPYKLTSMTVAKGHLCFAWIEEAFQIESEEDFDTFDESIRGQLPPHLWHQITITYNPWINNHWTKKRYWDNENPFDTFTLTTTHKCNEFLTQADHDKIEALKITNPARYKVVGLGEYGMPGGAYFDEFREDIHVETSFPIPSDWRRYRTTDYGLDMLACYWIALSPQGKAYVYKELYEGKDNGMGGHIVSAASRRIDEVNGDDIIFQTMGPPDMMNTQKDTGKSLMQLFQENGINLTLASNGRVAGWMNLKEWLAPYDDIMLDTGREYKNTNLVIFKNCKNLIHSFLQIQCDEADPNDVADKPHSLTHSVDAIRYFFSGRPFPKREDSKRKNNQNNWFEKQEERSDLDIW